MKGKCPMVHLFDIYDKEKRSFRRFDAYVDEIRSKNQSITHWIFSIHPSQDKKYLKQK